LKIRSLESAKIISTGPWNERNRFPTGPSWVPDIFLKEKPDFIRCASVLLWSAVRVTAKRYPRKCACLKPLIPDVTSHAHIVPSYMNFGQWSWWQLKFSTGAKWL